MGALCRMHHRYKTIGGAHLTQLSPGVFCWTTPRRLQYVTHPDRPLLDHHPADHDISDLADDGGATNHGPPVDDSELVDDSEPADDSELVDDGELVDAGLPEP